jgi:NYN domain
MSANASLQTAVLIDGENVAASDFPRLQTCLKSIAGIAITRVFGDFANGAHSNWLEICRAHGLEPVLHCSPVTGKNGTDILMTIAAMDILAMATFRRIVLVSSDSDFLPLVRRLRAGGIEVVGIGRTAPTVQLSATYSNWMKLGDPPAKTAGKPKAQTKTVLNSLTPVGFAKIVQEIVGSNSMTLSAVGKALRQSAPELVPVLGKGKLKKHIIAAGGFQVEGDLVRKAA